MTIEISFDGTTGVLRAPPSAWAVLRAVIGGSDTVDDAARRELESAHVLVGDAVHPSLVPALAAIRAPICSLALSRGSRTASAWIDGRVAALHLPEPDGRLTLTTVPTSFVPIALAKMNDLSPRPHCPPRAPLRLRAGELATLLAFGRAGVAAHREGPEAVRALVAGLREHWRVEARWARSPASPGVRVVEVVDTRDGLWLVTPDDPYVELSPSTPSAVFEALVRLLPRDADLAGGAGTEAPA